MQDDCIIIALGLPEVRVVREEETEKEITVEVMYRAPSAPCPWCGQEGVHCRPRPLERGGAVAGGSASTWARKRCTRRCATWPIKKGLRQVPMERLSWAIQTPGSFETDLVHHCGPVTAGEYVHTLQLVDIASGWSERVAVFGRSQATMVAAFQRVQERLPFPITHLHPDNGSEFFNNHLLRYFGEAMAGLRLSRSRPYRKNDNRFVEQKNASLVRAYVGYESPDTSGTLCGLECTL